MNKIIKTSTDSESFIAEIVGEESLLGQRMTAGPMLHMMDIAAASSAARYSETPIVTLAFDRIELLDYICHGDYVRYDSCIIQAGRSSMVVKVDAHIKAPHEMEMKPGHSGVITMVAIDENRKPYKNIPELEYISPQDFERKAFAEARMRLLDNRQKMIESIDRMDDIPLTCLNDFYNRRAFLTPLDTGLIIRKMFLPRNTNILGNVFGGDTIEMMEELALATARQFTGNFRMVTIAMEDVLFIKPLLLEDLVEMNSQVIFVAKTTLVIEITVRAVNFYKAGISNITNKGLFTVLNLDRAGKSRTINVGLDMSETDLSTRKRYLKEQIKYEKRTGMDK